MRRVGHAIPTVYSGVRFRSRAEARWAVMLDSMGWKWAYESLDLAGYIPDFMVDLGANILLMEVKGSWDEFDLAESKVECSEWDGLAIVVAQDSDGAPVGRFRDFDGVQFVWGELALMTCGACGKVSPIQLENSWHCRCCGYGRGLGNEHVGHFEADDAWDRAGNVTQWRKRA